MYLQTTEMLAMQHLVSAPRESQTSKEKNHQQEEELYNWTTTG